MWPQGRGCHDVQVMNQTASPDVRARRRAYRSYRGPVARRGRVRTRPAPRAAGAVGADGFAGPGRVRRLRRGAVRRPVDVPARAAAHPAAVPGPGRRHPAGQAPGRQQRRLADYGPLVAVGAIAIGVLLLVTLATGQTCPSAPAAGGRAVWPCCGGRRTRPSAPVERPVPTDGPDPRYRRRRWLAGLLRIGPG